MKEIVIVKATPTLGVTYTPETARVFQAGQEVIVIKVHKYLHYFSGDPKTQPI